jgi:hypothetical protein
MTSTHVHLGIPFPLGEQLVIPASGGYSWPYLAQSHNGIGAKVRGVRGGGFQMGTSGLSYDPDFRSGTIATQDFRHVGSIPNEADKPAAWRSVSGTFENRFTFDTTSPFGKRQYQSGAWNAQLNAAAAPVRVTARGWYEGPGYTNVTLQTRVQAHTLETTGLPSTLSYSVDQGAKWAFAYVDANIHGGSKGTVIFENRTAAGTFNLPVLPPGPHVLLLGAWEKAATGWNAGVLRLPFQVP